MEAERETAPHLRGVETAFAHGLIDCGGEEECLVDLLRQDFHQEAVVFGFSIEGKQALEHLHVFDDLIERLIFIGF